MASMVSFLRVGKGRGTGAGALVSAARGLFGKEIGRSFAAAGGEAKAASEARGVGGGTSLLGGLGGRLAAPRAAGAGALARGLGATNSGAVAEGGGEANGARGLGGRLAPPRGLLDKGGLDGAGAADKDSVDSDKGGGGGGGCRFDREFVRDTVNTMGAVTNATTTKYFEEQKSDFDRYKEKDLLTNVVILGMILDRIVTRIFEGKEQEMEEPEPPAANVEEMAGESSPF